MYFNHQDVMYSGTCDGCTKHCKLTIVNSPNAFYNQRLAINGRLVGRYIDKNNASKLAAARVQEDVIALIPSIISVCDFYNAKLVPMDADFSQDKGTNIAKCDGCEKRCALGARRDCALGGYMPYINGNEILSFQDANGENCSVVPNFDTSIGDVQTIELARKIAGLCTKYKTR